MNRNMVSRGFPFLFAVVVVAACSGGNDGARDSLNRDLDLAGARSSGTVDLNDYPPKGGSSGGGGTTVAPRTGSVPSGSVISLASQSRVCTNTSKIGDTFTARVKEAVSGSNGVAIPQGSTAQVQITSLSGKENAKDHVDMGFVVQSLYVDGKTYPIDSHITAVQTVTERSSDNKDAQKVVGGAVVGAVIGQILGKDTKSTVIGAATGAAAGTVVAMATGNYDGCIPKDGSITIALNAPVTVTIVQ